MGIQNTALWMLFIFPEISLSHARGDRQPHSLETSLRVIWILQGLPLNDKLCRLTLFKNVNNFLGSLTFRQAPSLNSQLMLRISKKAVFWRLLNFQITAQIWIDAQKLAPNSKMAAIQNRWKLLRRPISEKLISWQIELWKSGTLSEKSADSRTSRKDSFITKHLPLFIKCTPSSTWHPRLPYPTSDLRNSPTIPILTLHWGMSRRN